MHAELRWTRPLMECSEQHSLIHPGTVITIDTILSTYIVARQRAGTVQERTCVMKAGGITLLG